MKDEAKPKPIATLKEFLALLINQPTPLERYATLNNLGRAIVKKELLDLLMPCAGGFILASVKVQTMEWSDLSKSEFHLRAQLWSINYTQNKARIEIKPINQELTRLRKKHSELVPLQITFTVPRNGLYLRNGQIWIEQS